jgi:ATP-binding cassette subfamily B protein
MRPYRWQFVVMFLLGLCMMAAGVTVPLVIRSVIDGPLTHGDRSALLPLCGLVLLLGALDSGLATWRRWLGSRAVLDLERDVRNELYDQLQVLPISFHDRWMSGQLLSRMTSDLSAVRRFLSFGLIFLVLNLTLFVYVCGLLIRIDLLLGLVTTAFLIPVGLECARFERRFTQVSRQVQDQQGDLASTIEESATGVRVIKAFGRRRLMAQRFDGQARDIYATQLEKVRLRGNLITYLDVNPNVMLAILLLLGALAVSRRDLTLGDLVAFITLTMTLIWPIEALGFIIASAQEAGTAAQRVFEVLDTESEITDPSTPSDPSTAPSPSTEAPSTEASSTEAPSIGPATIPAPARPVTAGIAPLRPSIPGPPPKQAGSIRFENVGFRFASSRRDALQGITLELHPGETIAVVGASGAGKTTLAMLLPRLADPTAGRVLLDGRDLRRIPLPQLRSRVSTAFEDPVLFSASVRENVTLGRPGADDAEVREALAVAQAHFVDDLPWGLETRIGEQGMSLSGGQRQRLALARAVLGRPEVLVLDDPLSALDVETEHLVEQALRAVLASTTALVVVHRPSTISLADRVAMLREGGLVAVGTHDELLAEQPGYADLLGVRM